MTTLLHRTSPALAVLTAFAFFAAPAAAQVVFDDFNDGDVSDIGVFSQTNTGIGVGTTEGTDGTADTGLSIGVNPADTGTFAGFVIPGGAGTTDISAQNTLTFFLRPTSVQAANLPLTLEINLHEDVNGNGTYEGATEDEFQATYAVQAGTGYMMVSIPLAAFTDDNSVFPGANDGFDYTKLLEVVVAIGGPTGPEYAFAMDEIVFTEAGPPALGPITIIDDFSDGDVSDIGVFSQTNAGIGVGTTDDASGTPDRALSVGVNSADTGTFAGFVVPGSPGVQDVDGSVAFVFQIRPTVVATNLPLTLEINLHEDVNGNGTYEGATEDEFQATYSVTGSSTDFVEVIIPITAFVDDNSVFPGANDGFDYTKLLEVVFAIGSPTGPEYAISFDEIGFAAPGTAVELPPTFATAPVTFPNPTAGNATVAFELATASVVSVDVYDLMGRRVARLAEGPQAAGEVRLGIPTGTLSAGVYLVRVQTEAGIATSRLTVVR